MYFNVSRFHNTSSEDSIELLPDENISLSNFGQFLLDFIFWRNVLFILISLFAYFRSLTNLTLLGLFKSFLFFGLLLLNLPQNFLLLLLNLPLDLLHTIKSFHFLPLLPPLFSSEKLFPHLFVPGPGNHPLVNNFLEGLQDPGTGLLIINHLLHQGLQGGGRGVVRVGAGGGDYGGHYQCLFCFWNCNWNCWGRPRVLCSIGKEVLAFEWIVILLFWRSFIFDFETIWV